MRCHHLLDARQAEHLALGVVRLHQPIAEEQQAVSRRERYLTFVVAHAGHQSERHASRTQLAYTVALPHVGVILAGVGEVYVPAVWVEHGVEAGDEHAGGNIGAEQFVHPRQHVAWRCHLARGSAEHRARGCHHECGRDTLAGHIAEHQAHRAVLERQNVVEIAADLARGLIIRRQLPAGIGGYLLGQEGALDLLRGAQLLGDALALAHLRLLLVYQLRHADRRRALCREGVEQRALFASVILDYRRTRSHDDQPEQAKQACPIEEWLHEPRRALSGGTQARTQQKQPEQHSLTRQRHYDLHTVSAQIPHERRIDPHPIELQRGGVLQCVGQERVVIGNDHRRGPFARGGAAHPERERCRVQRALQHVEELVAHLIQVDLLAERRRHRFKRHAVRVPVEPEPALQHPLDPCAHGLEDDGDSEGCGDDDDLGRRRGVSEHLKAGDGAEIGERDDCQQKQ